MGIEISGNGSKEVRLGRPGSETPSPEGKTFQHHLGSEFGSYEYALQATLKQKKSGKADIEFHPHQSDEKLGVKITVGENSVIINHLLSIAPNQVATTMVQKATALGAITLPAHLQPFIKPRDMAGGDLAAMIMGRYIHITREGDIFTPPEMMIGGGPDTWHKVKKANEANLIMPDWLHGGINNVTINGGILEGITWKKQKIRIRPNGEISQVKDQAEFTLDKKGHIHLVIPDCLIDKISFNGEQNRLPLFGHVGYVGDKEANEYICIEPRGIVKKMGKPGGWKQCSPKEIQRLGQYPTQVEIQKITRPYNRDTTRQLVERLKALQGPAK